MRTLLVACFALALAHGAAAQKLSAPASDASSMVVLMMTVNVKGAFLASGDKVPNLVVIGRVGADGKVEQEYVPTALHRNYVFFENLPAGRYRLLQAVYVHSPQAGPPTMPAQQPKPGFSVSSSTTFSFGSAPRADIAFDPKVSEASILDLAAGTVGYMGDYRTQTSLRASFPSPVLTINGSEGSRTDEGRNKAWEMLKAEYPQSPWIQRIPKDAPAPAAPPQTDAPQKDEKPQ